jgi:hypothetical protein
MCPLSLWHARMETAGSSSSSNREALAGLVERVTFHNTDNGFCVLRVKARGHRDLVTVLGEAPSISAGEYIQASGRWETHRDHGQQFRATFLRVTPPTSTEGMERYLGSGLIKGIGRIFAQRLVSAFSEAVFEVIEHEPNRLLEVEGIGKKRAERITASWADQKVIRDGGSVIVPPRFSASEFWKLFREHRATWYSAVPTIHDVLLARADSDGSPHSGPRFIRSCSAPLAPTILTKLENRFGAPVLEAYGMTEASHQVTTNPPPPLPHKPGTVGPGPGVSIIDETGRHLAANTPGEVAVRGPNVMRGYRNNPEANAAFIDGWFRTGDIGAIDDDGYLALTGRIKDLINRGGEKISPAKVEAVLLEHPAVAEAAVFGVPDPKYGEEISAAVVLRGAATAEQLQKYCRTRLADFKVPTEIHLVSAIPRNAMGKVQRRDLTASFS